MNGLRHILVMVALLVAAFPCCHAHEHELRAPDAHAPTELTATHHCCCHSCDATLCVEELEMPQDLTLPAATVASPPPAITLMVFTESKPATPQVPPLVCDALASLQTVQLLI
ncbi:hypothetical protein [Pontiella sp.]|uniref:hypothetical protein n=1 Tax=Pontiella sp. TaxID=2837462 RepID=UPI0035693DF0